MWKNKREGNNLLRKWISGNVSQGNPWENPELNSASNGIEIAR
jgi:hypothetical protein